VRFFDRGEYAVGVSIRIEKHVSNGLNGGGVCACVDLGRPHFTEMYAFQPAHFENVTIAWNVVLATHVAGPTRCVVWPVM